MSWLAPLVQWSTKFTSKVYIVRDFFESTVVGASNDCLVTRGVQGVQRKVRKIKKYNILCEWLTRTSLSCTR
jgi:hypothetical protein